MASSSSLNINKILIVTNEGLSDYQQILSSDTTLLQNSPEIYFTDSADQKLASQCNIWLGSPSLIASLLQSCSSSPPEWVQSTWAGVEPYVVDGMPTNYILTNMRGIFNEFIAEYAVGHMLSHALNVRQHLTNNAEQTWSNHVRPKRLAGQTAGILGVGEIGSEVARLCKAMGMTVHGYTRSSEGCKHVDQYFHGDSITEMAPGIDYWVNIMPNTPNTINILNKEVFASMKDGAVIINAGRGKAIHDEDLLEALDSGKVDAAILDVFRTEPLPPEHPYWSHPKVLVTSHTAAPTEPKDAVPVFVENYERWCSGDQLKYQVVFERGY
jgi:phosphoglycerate dehydrogenase-like enzyme